MKRTKLQLVQDILSALDLHEVSSIGETIESEQVAAILDSMYDDLNGDGHTLWPHLRSYTNLEITTQANQLRIPDDVMTIRFVWYENKLLEYKSPKEMHQVFLDRIAQGNSNVDSNGAYNDTEPTYWTSYDDVNVLLDAYDGSLVAANSTAEVYSMPAQMTADTDYPDLPERFHKTLYHGALADCFYTLKGDTTGFNIFNNRFRRERISMKRWSERVDQNLTRFDKYNFGRKVTS